MQLKSKTLFLLDGIGALLSATILGGIFPKFEHSIGMPVNTLYFLAFFPVVFLIYDMYCYLVLKKNFGKWLTGIAVANLVYCGISVLSIYYHYENLTHWGFAYFLLEIAIIIILARIELKVASRTEI